MHLRVLRPYCGRGSCGSAGEEASFRGGVRRTGCRTICSAAGWGAGLPAIALCRSAAAPSLEAALALEVARGNARKHGVRVTFHESDWFAALQSRKWHMMISNPPYIAADDPHLAGLSAEPESALVAADRGIAALAHIIDQSPNFLYEKGWLLLEHGYDQAESVRGLMAARGFTGIKSVVDLGNIERVTMGQWHE